MKYYEAFAERGFHSAFLTTYSFGAQAFEDIPFSRLRGSGCRNIVVLADRQMVNQSFAEFGSPRFAGSSYHLVKADAAGAFHPKITLLIGAGKGRLLVGSANLTALGLGGNKELVADIAYSPETPGLARFFVEALAYIHSKVPADDPWFATAMQRAMRAAPWLRDSLESTASPEEEAALLLDRPGRTILEQIAHCVGADPVERLIVMSPYWDAKLEGLARLRDALGSPPTDLLIDAESTSFPKSELHRFPDLKLFSTDTLDSDRFVHAKLVIAQGRSWDHVISGSMNCTLPALAGHSVAKGNAEAGIYRRVASGAALPALELEGYPDAPLQPTDLLDLAVAAAIGRETVGYVDGGTIILHPDHIVWDPPPTGAPRAAISLSLYDRDGVLFGQVMDLMGHGKRSWLMDFENGRPKSGVVRFADGMSSAPIQVVDLAVLAARTLPPALGRRKSLSDVLGEAANEDLFLIEALNQLEALDMEESGTTAAGLTSDSVPATISEPAAQRHAVLPYEEFVRARSTAAVQGSLSPGAFPGHHGSAASTLSTALNRLIGLVGADLDAEEDRELSAIDAMDFRVTEPAAAVDSEPPALGNEAPKPTKATKQSVATARKMKDAVDAFEERCRSLMGKPIGTAELVRLRALLQIVLYHAQPIRGAASPAQILPVHAGGGYDWPRLVGRLLMQHFGSARALQSLRVEQDEAEQKRVLEYLALADWAARAAAQAARSHPKLVGLRGQLDILAKALQAQVALILEPVEDDRRYFGDFCSKLDERFAHRLSLPVA